MQDGFLNLAEVRPWWLRLGLLLTVGSPLLTGGVLHARLHPEHFYRDLAMWTAYGVFIWLFVGSCAGLRRLVDWLTFAVLISLTIVLTGAAFRKLGIWQPLETLWMRSPTDPERSVMDLVFRLLVILSATPYGLLTLSSFPASDLIRWVSRRGAVRRTAWALRAAIFLRMLQNVAEVVSRSLVAWREENPALLVPRFRSDWRGSLLGRLRFFDWAWLSVFSWCTAIATQSLEAVPLVVRDFRRMGQ